MDYNIKNIYFFMFKSPTVEEDINLRLGSIDFLYNFRFKICKYIVNLCNYYYTRSRPIYCIFIRNLENIIKIF
jgi:hypothetical protein